MSAAARDAFLAALQSWDELPAYTPRAIFDGRKAAVEARLVETAAACPDVPKGRTRRLLRGITLTSRGQVEAVLSGKPFRVPQTGLSSWTRSAGTARSFASEWEACGNGIVIRRPTAELDVLVDLRATHDSMTPEERRRHPISMSAVIESEVIVRNTGPDLLVRPEDVAWMNPRLREMLESTHLDELAREVEEIRSECADRPIPPGWAP